ncbi:MAG: aminoacyl-tRNA hydrolase [Phycisphaeraceae bacterium]|nr:aminoacyl-tRNA hydrolase [Phycisphaeraceae bacterium]
MNPTLPPDFTARQLLEAIAGDAISWESSRSEGPGGQNVNKRNTRATLRLRLEALEAHLPERCARRLVALAGSRINRAGELVLHGDEHRSIMMNRRACLARLEAMIESALRVPAARKPTRPTRSSKRKRLLTKRRRGRVKRLRGDPDVDE